VIKGNIINSILISCDSNGDFRFPVIGKVILVVGISHCNILLQIILEIDIGLTITGYSHYRVYFN